MEFSQEMRYDDQLQGILSMSKTEEGYCACRSVEDAKNIAAPFDYIAEAMVTMSPSWHGGEVPYVTLRTVLAEAIEALKKLDKIKKALFYGRALPEDFCQQQDFPLSQRDPKDCLALPGRFDESKYGEYVIHAIIGAATETGELLEALQKVIISAATETGEAFDEVNIREEVGDVFWYIAALASACNFTFEDAQRANIAKLRHRFPDRFTEYDANNRDLFGERRILEEGGNEKPILGNKREA